MLIFISKVGTILEIFMKNFIKYLYVFLSSLPALFILCFYTLVFRFYASADRFPKFNDPVDSRFPIHDELLTSLVLGIIFLALPWLVITVVGFMSKNLFSYKFISSNLIFCISSILLLILLAVFDPTTSWQWFFD